MKPAKPAKKHHYMVIPRDSDGTTIKIDDSNVVNAMHMRATRRQAVQNLHDLAQQSADEQLVGITFELRRVTKSERVSNTHTVYHGDLVAAVYLCNDPTCTSVHDKWTN